MGHCQHMLAMASVANTQVRAVQTLSGKPDPLTRNEKVKSSILLGGSEGEWPRYLHRQGSGAFLMRQRIWTQVGHRVGQSVSRVRQWWLDRPAPDGDAWWHDGDGEWFRGTE